MLATPSAWVLALLALVAGACRTTDLEDFDRLARTTEARTIAYEKDFSLYSPFDVSETRDWLKLLAGELAEVAELLEVDPAEQRDRRGPLIVQLQEVQGLKPRASLAEEDRIHFAPAPEQHPLHGLEGYAHARRVVVFVEAATTLTMPDGRVVRGTWSASEFRSTLRHELAHALAFSEGIEGEAWLGEGLALLVEHARTASAGIEPEIEIEPGVVRHCRRVARKAPALADLLIVHEDLQGIVEGRTQADAEWRPRLLAFFVFLLERELARGGDVRSTIDGARRAGRGELERLEPEWRAWLEPGPSDEPGGAATDSPAGASNAR